VNFVPLDYTLPEPQPTFHSFPSIGRLTSDKDQRLFFYEPFFLSLHHIGGLLMAVYRSEKDFLQSLKRFNAISSQRYGWHSCISEKKHVCEFGHDIPPENVYFKKPLDMDGDQKLRVCKPCMETIVYVTVDSDPHAKETTDILYKQKNPARTKVADMMEH